MTDLPEELKKLALLQGLWTAHDLLRRSVILAMLREEHKLDIEEISQRTTMHPLSVVRLEIMAITGKPLEEHPQVVASEARRAPPRSRMH